MNNQNYKLSELTTLIARGITPKYTDSTDSISVVNQKCIRDGKINFDLCRKHNHHSKRISSEKILQINDILINSTGVGTLGRVSQIIDDLSKTTCDSHVTIVRPDPTKIDPSFLGAFTYLNQKNIESLGHGSTGQTELSRLDIGEIDVPKISDKKQKFIGDFFQFLNRKIELNQKTNETLEKIAQALFKSWFIDFDPVKAKSESRSTGLPDEMSDLFPDSFEDSELGVIPKGWGIKSLPNIFDFLEGPGIRNWQYTNDETGIRFINIRCINNGDLNVETSNRITEEEALGKYKHFALLEDDIVVSTSGTLGKYAIVRKEHLPLNLNTSVIRFRPIENQSTFSFLYGFIENKLQYELETRASGSVQRNFGPMHLREIELLLPNINLLKVHEKYVEDLFKKRKLNLGENNLLSNLRDTLLPKLISGELRIPDAEKMIEEVGI